jgi:hypothetical protein
MTKLTVEQVGWASQKALGMFRDPRPTVECPFCDKRMNPTGNIGTHTAKHPTEEIVAYWRAHKSCTKEALPTEIEALNLEALALLEKAREDARGRANLLQ